MVQWLGLDTLTMGLEFNPWSGSWYPTSQAVQQKKKERKKGRKKEKKKVNWKIYSHGFVNFCCHLVTQLCLSLCNPMDCSLPGSSVHGILQVRILEWVAVYFSRWIFWTRGSNPHLLQVSCIGRQILYYWASRELGTVLTNDGRELLNR